LFSGRIIRRKGLHLAIEAFLDIAEANDHVWLLVAGASPKHFGLGAKTEESIRKTDRIAFALRMPHPRIIYLGPVNMKVMPLYYASSDVAIVPSDWEDPCPLTCAEAQASAIPVLGTARGGIPDSVIHGKTGLICQPDVKDIRRNMIRLIKDKNLVKSLSKNARKRAMRRLDWNLVADSIRSLYQTTVAEKPRRL
ncbi:MAG: glycosyltransferase family 4 protein, partial [Candidatus Hodarchaeota archaeon]